MARPSIAKSRAASLVPPGKVPKRVPNGVEGIATAASAPQASGVAVSCATILRRRLTP